jgi:IS30 family transposase
VIEVLSNKQKDQIVILKTIEHKNNTEIAQLVGVNRGTVIKVLKDGWKVNQQFLDTYKETVQQQTKEMLDMIKGDKRLTSITGKILELFNSDEELEKEIQKGGLKSLATIYGVLADKVIRVSDLHLRVEKQTFDTIMNSSETMNDNFEKAIVDSLQSFNSNNTTALIEPDSIEEDESHVSIVQ